MGNWDFGIMIKEMDNIQYKRLNAILKKFKNLLAFNPLTNNYTKISFFLFIILL